MNSPPILEPILMVRLVDVRWGLADLDFDPWPMCFALPFLSPFHNSAPGVSGAASEDSRHLFVLSMRVSLGVAHLFRISESDFHV